MKSKEVKPGTMFQMENGEIFLKVKEYEAILICEEKDSKLDFGATDTEKLRGNEEVSFIVFNNLKT